MLNPHHLDAIMAVAEKTPHTRHWLPTQERWVLLARCPDNLIVRLSGTKIDKAPPSAAQHWSIVLTRERWESSPIACPAPLQGNECGTCRKCWDRGVTGVAYLKH